MIAAILWARTGATYTPVQASTFRLAAHDDDDGDDDNDSEESGSSEGGGGSSDGDGEGSSDEDGNAEAGGVQDLLPAEIPLATRVRVQNWAHHLDRDPRTMEEQRQATEEIVILMRRYLERLRLVLGSPIVGPVTGGVRLRIDGNAVLTWTKLVEEKVCLSLYLTHPAHNRDSCRRCFSMPALTTHAWWSGSTTAGWLEQATAA